MKSKTFISLIYLLLTFTLWGNNSFISGVFIDSVSTYYDISIEGKVDNNKPSPSYSFINDIIEVVSGLIYGWDFSYTPSDIKREIDEIFTITPIAKIKKGDKNMRFKDSWKEENIMHQNIVYHLSNFQRKRIASWHTSVTPTSSGSGESSIYQKNGKSESLHNAIKDSIKKEFQSRGMDKPRNIKGQILLSKNPRVYIASGKFFTNVKVLLVYKEIQGYKYH